MAHNTVSLAHWLGDPSKIEATGPSNDNPGQHISIYVWNEGYRGCTTLYLTEEAARDLRHKLGGALLAGQPAAQANAADPLAGVPPVADGAA